VSLLRRGNGIVKVFPEEATTDSDGNTITRASSVGVICRATVQPLSSGTNSEVQDFGAEPGERLRLRLVGWQGPELGAQSQVEWQGRRYSVHGEPRRYNGSRRTRHTDYTLVRK